MSQSLTKLFVHITFHVKRSSVLMRKEEQKSLYAYIGSIIKDNQSIPIIINGVENHIHILCVQSKNIAMSKLVEEIKRHSSRWIKTQNEYYETFSWQGGYAAFSVSPSVLQKTITYIENQEEHHRNKNEKEELILFLKQYDLEYNEKYLLEDD